MEKVLESVYRVICICSAMRMRFITNTVAVIFALLVSSVLTEDISDNQVFKRQFEPNPKVLGPFGLATSSRNARRDSLFASRVTYRVQLVC